jgi:16S rRNA G966 N2-methylase RsmD
MIVDYHMDAVDFLQKAIDAKIMLPVIDTVVLDPPYSYRKSMELYNGHKNSRFKIVKDLICEITDKGSTVITFGYQSVSMGIKRGFQVKEIALFSHGGAIRDTIATVEVKIK